MIQAEEDEMGWACGTNGEEKEEEEKDVCRLLVGKPEVKRPLGRPRLRWADNIGMDLGEIGWGDVNCIGLVQDRDNWRALVKAVMNLRLP
jgi:hypothetical protein